MIQKTLHFLFINLEMNSFNRQNLQTAFPFFSVKLLWLLSRVVSSPQIIFQTKNFTLMKNVMKRPLKVIAAAAFMVALGYGVATNSKISELSSFVNLSALSGVSAQGETGGEDRTRLVYCTWYSSRRGCRNDNQRTCSANIFCE